jgi:hypothetical protein
MTSRRKVSTTPVPVLFVINALYAQRSQFASFLDAKQMGLTPLMQIYLES